MDDLKQKLITKLKSHAPLIYNSTATMDMGCEFSAITEKGVIYQNPGMLLGSETNGHLPDWDYHDEKNNDKTIEFLETLDIVPFENLSLDELEYFLEDIEDFI